MHRYSRKSRGRRISRSLIAATATLFPAAALGQVTFLNSFNGGQGTNSGPLGFACGVAVDPAGNVFATDFAQGNVEAFSPTGVQENIDNFAVSSLISYLDSPVSIAVGPGESFCINDLADFGLNIATGGKDYISDYDGVVGPPEPRGCAYGPDGNIYLAYSNTNQVAVVSPTGAALSEFGIEGSGNGQFQNPYGIGVNQAGDIYVVDSGNNRVQVFNSSGNFLNSFGSSGTGHGQFNTPTTLALDSLGNAYVIDYGNGRVEIFNSSGVFEGSFGSFGNAPGQFGDLQGIAVSATGMIYVANDGGPGTGVERFFNPSSWVSGTNTFTDPSVGPTSITLDVPLTLNTSMSLTVADTLNLNSGGSLTVSGGALSVGTIALGSGGALTVPALTLSADHTLSQTGGTLTVGSLNVNGTPSLFTWTGGTLQLTAQPLNFTSGSDVNASFGSSLTLGSGQTLIVDNWEWLYGEGAYLSQNTGSSNTCQGLYIGPTAGSGSVADYFQDGGSLTSTVSPEYVGYAFSGGPGGIGYFYQYGGTNKTPELDVGYSNTGVIGEYDLYNGATLTVSGNEYLGVYSQGTLNQNGGTHAIGLNLLIGGSSSGAIGAFNLDAGYLDVTDVNVGGSAGQGAFTLSGGTATIFVNLNVASTAGSYLYQSGGSLSASGTSNNGLIEQTGGTSYLGILSGTGSTTIGGGSSTATMTVAGLNQSAVVINSMGTLKVIGGTDNAVNTLAINGGQLDLTNTHLFIDYGGGPDPIASIAAWIASGYAGGSWNGTGIMSTAAQANSLSYGIGYADSADPGNPANLSSGTIEIKYTLLGDANLDGVVNAIDFGILAANFNKGVTGWDQGDFNYDNVVNAIDFGELAANFNKGASGASFGPSALSDPALVAFAEANGLMADVPEPASMALFAAGVVATVARRRRRALWS